MSGPQRAPGLPRQGPLVPSLNLGNDGTLHRVRNSPAPCLPSPTVSSLLRGSRELV